MPCTVLNRVCEAELIQISKLLQSSTEGTDPELTSRADKTFDHDCPRCCFRLCKNAFPVCLSMSFLGVPRPMFSLKRAQCPGAGSHECIENRVFVAFS